MLTSIATVIHKKTGSSSRLHLRHLTRCRLAQYNARTSTISKVFLTPGERLVIPAYTTTKRHPSHIHVDPHIFCVGNARKKSMKPQHPNTLVGNPIYRQALIDKTDDCVHTTAGDMWRAPGRRVKNKSIRPLVYRNQTTKNLDPAPMAKHRHFGTFEQSA